MIAVAPGTVVIFSDIGCPWAHLAVHRLFETRAELGLEESLAFDHRAFVLEMINRRPTPKNILDSEVPVAGALAPAAGWQMWQGDLTHYPVTTLPALEAVQAAKNQGLEASAQLDRALRVAFFGESRCISMHHVILEVAEECPGVDAGALEEALAGGQARRAVFEQHAMSSAAGVEGSPHVFVDGGAAVHNPGIEMRWEGEKGRGFPVVTADHPDVYRHLLRRAVSKAA